MTKVLMEISVLEAAHLTDLVEQFAALIADTVDDPALDDPAIRRLVPDAYRDDPSAAAEFRELTQDDLLDRRRDDAGLVLTTLQRDGVTLRPQTVADDATEAFVVELDGTTVAAWLRTLASIRLVMATRLGIASEDDRGDPDDPRFGVYDWLGFRLEGLLQALED